VVGWVCFYDTCVYIWTFSFSENDKKFYIWSVKFSHNLCLLDSC
jgi:hypothetical protein